MIMRSPEDMNKIDKILRECQEMTNSEIIPSCLKQENAVDSFMKLKQQLTWFRDHVGDK